MCACVRERKSVCACVRAKEVVCVCVCVRERGGTSAAKIDNGVGEVEVRRKQPQQPCNAERERGGGRERENERASDRESESERTSERKRESENVSETERERDCKVGFRMPAARTSSSPATPHT